MLKEKNRVGLFPGGTARLTGDASKGDWDLYDVLATIPGDQTFRPLSESACPAIKR